MQVVITKRAKSRRFATTFDNSDWEDSQVAYDQKDVCDINVIYQKTQLGELVNSHSSKPPQYGDFTNQMAYEEMLDFIIQTEQAFRELPSALRKEFNNNPREWYEATLKGIYDEAQAEIEADKIKAEEKERDLKLEEARKLVADNPPPSSKSLD